MKVLGKIFLFLIFAATVSMVYYWQVSHQPTVQSPVKVISPNNTYTNDDYGFEVRYNKQYRIDTSGNQEHYFKTGGITVATISIPSSVFPITNFGSGDATIAVKNRSSSEDCITYVTGEAASKKMVKTIVYGQNTFYTAELDGAALGTHYKTKIYRLLRESYCYEINLTVGIANIGNFDPESKVTEVTFDEVFIKLEPILRSFKLLPLSANGEVEGPSGSLSGRITASSPDAYDVTQIVVYSSDKTKIVTKVNLDSTGYYFVSLPEGIYYVTYTSIYDSFQPTMQKVTISEEEMATVNFSLGKN